MQRLFLIKKEPFFQKNDFILNTIYLPLIGKEAIYIYNYLISYHSYIIESDLKEKWSHNSILQKMNLSWESFESNREKLESIGLLKTQEHYYNKERIYNLISTKSFSELLENKKILNLLNNRLSKEELNKLDLLIQKANFQENSFLDISKDFTHLMNDDEIQNYYYFDFEQLNLDLISKTGNKIKLENNTKQLIENYYIKEHLPYLRILDMVLSSLNSNNDISLKILEMKLNDSLNEYKEQKNIMNININRKFDIFTEPYNPDKYNDIIADYKKHKSENYLISITKSDLTTNEIQLINSLRNDNGLKDEIINVIIDYSLFKNNGRFIINYTKSIAKTFMINRFYTIREAINWFNKIVNKNTFVKENKSNIETFYVSNDAIENNNDSKFYKYWGSKDNE